MTPAEFNHSVQDGAGPPAGLSFALQALWWVARGDWQRAHELAQADTTTAGSWVHAHLHRVEGDEGNAAYWYAKAARSMPQTSFEDERHRMVEKLLA